MDKVRGWRLPPVEKELLRRPSVDTAVATTMLAEGVERLVAHGAEKTQLLAKLRRDPYPWPAWAEIRAATILVNMFGEDVGVTLEPGRAKGKQPDFRLVMPDAKDGMSIEFKAIGLSDREAAFCRRMGDRLRRLVPRVGVMTGHTWDLDTPTIPLSAAHIREGHDEAERRAADVPGFPDGLSAAVVVAHETEAKYLVRLQGRLGEAIEQLPLDGESWVAFHWTNGAPVQSAFDAIDWAAVPEQVEGIMFVGDVVVFPDPDIHVFVIAYGRGARPTDDPDFESTLDDDYASLVFERVQGTSSVRATLVRGEVGPGRSRELLRRDGDPPIQSFNLVMSGDPPEFGPRGERSFPEEPEVDPCDQAARRWLRESERPDTPTGL